MHRYLRYMTVVTMLVTVLVASAGMAKERVTVTVSYALGPSKPIPEGLKAVAVIDAGVKTEGAQQDAREQKWSAIAADMVEAMLQSASAQFGTELAVAKRSQTKQILEEKDLRLSGLIEGADATRAGKLLAVQGLVTSKIVINLDVQKGSKSTIDWGGVLGGVVGGLGDADHGRRPAREQRPRPVVVQRSPVNPRDPRARPRVYLYNPGYRPTRSPRPEGGAIGGGFALKTKEVEEISRSLTVQCSFSLIDATTGRAIAQYSPPPYQKTDSSSPDFLFGNMINQTDLDPVDEFIGELVERATQEFVATLVPVRFEKEYEVTLSGKRGEAAVRAIRADDFAGAFEQLSPVIGSKEDKDGRISFAAGVVSEMLGKPDQALKFYRQAASSPDPDDKKDLPQYLEAKKRLSDHISRILSPAALKAAVAAPAPPPADEPVTPAPPPQTAPASVDDEVRAIKELDNDKPK